MALHSCLVHSECNVVLTQSHPGIMVSVVSPNLGDIVTYKSAALRSHSARSIPISSTYLSQTVSAGSRAPPSPWPAPLVTRILISQPVGSPAAVVFEVWCLLRGKLRLLPLPQYPTTLLFSSQRALCSHRNRVLSLPSQIRETGYSNGGNCLSP